LGRRLLGAVWNALARDHVHVLLLVLGVPVSRQNRQADEAVTLGHSATSWRVGNALRNRPFGRSLQCGRGAVAATLAGVRKKVRYMTSHFFWKLG